MNNREQELQKKIAKALGIPVENVIKTSFVILMEELIVKLEKSK